MRTRHAMQVLRQLRLFEYTYFILLKTEIDTRHTNASLVCEPCSSVSVSFQSDVKCWAVISSLFHVMSIIRQKRDEVEERWKKLHN
jgi:hypothetical protein